MDRDEFARRVRGVQDRLYRISCGLLRDPQDRMDAAQEAILKAWCGLDRLRNEEFFETWLIRILVNECHNRQRAQARLLPMDSAPELSDVDDRFAELRESVRELPEKLRIIVLLHYMEGYGTDEIAGLLRIPSGTVRSRLRRARLTLKDLLDEPDGRRQ